MQSATPTCPPSINKIMYVFKPYTSDEKNCVVFENLKSV